MKTWLLLLAVFMILATFVGQFHPLEPNQAVTVRDVKVSLGVTSQAPGVFFVNPDGTIIPLEGKFYNIATGNTLTSVRVDSMLHLGSTNISSTELKLLEYIIINGHLYIAILG